LIDITGKTVRAFSGGSNRMDGSELESGVYLLQVQTAKGLASKRLMKKQTRWFVGGDLVTFRGLRGLFFSVYYFPIFLNLYLPQQLSMAE
jgi:hypothetical protein